MDSKILDEIMEELSSTLEKIETQSAAILEFMKEKGIAKEEELAPYLERAGAASSVRWRATRVRLEHLFAGLEKSERQAEEQKKSEEQKRAKESEQAREKPADQEGKQKSAASAVPQGTEAAKAGGDQQSQGEQKHEVTAPSGPKTGEQEGKRSQDKRKNAA